MEDSPEPGGGDAAEEDEGLRSAESALGAASYWDGLLRAHWQALEKEEGGLAGRLGRQCCPPCHCHPACLQQRTTLVRAAAAGPILPLGRAAAVGDVLALG